jgi:hypothetical protein
MFSTFKTLMIFMTFTDLTSLCLNYCIARRFLDILGILGT